MFKRVVPRIGKRHLVQYDLNIFKLFTKIKDTSNI